MPERLDASTHRPDIASPCIRNCCLDENDICLGCFRSLEEICAWSEASETDRLKIRDHAEQRKQQRTYDQSERT